MNKVIWTTCLVLICTLYVYSQTAQTRARTSASGEAAASANGSGKTVNIASGTRLAAELQNTVDVRKAKVGDEVVLKTTEAIKSEGRTVVSKGARLIGHVTEVSEKTEANGESRLAILFDRLESGSLEISISASIASISKNQANELTNGAVSDTSGSSSVSARQATTGQRTSSSGSVIGSVVGGVTNAVGGVVNTTTTTTGDVLGNTRGSAGSTINGVGRSLGKIQVSESTEASASGSSLLSLRGENLRVEKGTTFNLLLTQAVSEGTPQ
jgi:hypothetical protein